MTTKIPFWFSEAIAKEKKIFSSPLKDNTRTNICIVGGGYTGLWTALQLKKQEPNIDIIIIDKNLCGSGASGRNGGCMLTLSSKFLSMKKLLGQQEAIRLIKASEDALFNIKKFCRDNDIKADLRFDGVVMTATNTAQRGLFSFLENELSLGGINSWEYWPQEKVQQYTGSQSHLDGYFSPIAGSVQPALLVRGLKKVAESLGVRIYENTSMIKITENYPGIVHTNRGNIIANKIVLAVNAWMPELFPKLNRSILLVSSDILITEPIPKLLNKTGLADGKTVLDSCVFVNYYHRTSDGRLMIGKGGNYFTYNNKVVPVFDQASPYKQQLKQSLKRFFPSLKSIRIEQTWSGASDRSITGLPFFGYLNNKPNIVYGFGYSGNGIGPSYLGGTILSSMVLELDNEWTRSALVKGPLGNFPPEPIRFLGAIAVRNAIRRKERAEDKEKKPWWIDTQLAKFARTSGKIDY